MPEVRPIRPGEEEALARALAPPFLDAPNEENVVANLPLIEVDRTRVYEEDGLILANSMAWSLRFSVPGGELPGAGITWIGVHPSRRRRGLLRAMMEGLLTDARERSEPVAGLWASEMPIYGRFGFEDAAPVVECRIERVWGAFRGDLDLPSVTIEHAPADAGSVDRLDALYERVRAQRGGMPTRTPTFWTNHTMRDTAARRADGELAAIFARGADADEGYALYRAKGGWTGDGNPDGTITMNELMAATPGAHAALWRWLLDHDLVRTVVAELQPPDDALPHLLADPRRLSRRLFDGLQFAVLDVPAALAGRRYATSDELVLEVVGDAASPDVAGTYRLDGGPDGADCRRDGRSADVMLTARALAAIYLGGHHPFGLMQAGHIRAADPRAITRLGAMFAAPAAPWSSRIF